MMAVADRSSQITRLAAVLSRLELVADQLGAANAPANKVQARTELVQLVVRLEKAASSLENKSSSTALESDDQTAVRPAVRPAVRHVHDCGNTVERFDKIIKSKLVAFLDLSDQLGGDVKAQAHVVHDAFKAQRDFILKSTKAKKPNQDVFAAMLRKTSLHVKAAEELKGKEFGNRNFNHLSAVSEGIGALGWVAMIRKPSEFVKEKSDAAQFFLNRVLKEFKETDRRHVDWVRAFQGTLEALKDYTKENYPRGLTWGK